MLYVSEIVPGWLAMAVGKYVIERFRDFPGAIEADFVHPVCKNGYVTTTFVRETDVVPVFVIVKVCGALIVPSGWLENVIEVVLSVGIAAEFVP